jgi:predicted PurR-regulated permease PerM
MDENTAAEDTDRSRGPNQTLTVSLETNTIWKVVVIVLATMAGLWMMGQARGLLGQVAFSFFLSLALQPLVMRLVHRFGWRRGSAVGVIYLGGLVVLLLFTFILIPAIVSVATAIGENGKEWLTSGAQWMEDTFGVTIESGFDNDVTTDLANELEAWALGAVGNIIGLATTGIGLLFSLATIAMFTFYFTADAPRFQRSVLSLLSPQQQQRVGWTWDQAVIQTGGYFYSRIILMMINATGFFFTMVAVGLPVAMSLALALIGSFIAAFIPAIGTYLGSAIPILFALAFSGWVAAVIILAYALIYQQIENYFLSPKISANTMTLNGAVAFGGALAGGAIFGPIGAFVALPVAALITAFVSNFANHNDVVYEFEYDKLVEATKQQNKKKAKEVKALD